LRKGGAFRGTYSDLQAVDGLSLSLKRGETLGLVGESGSGKTTTGMLALRLVEPTAGQILLGGTDITRLPPAALKPHRRGMQVIFQDSYSALDPMFTLLKTVAEPLVIHGIGDDHERTDRVKALLAAVGLDMRHLRRYPHSFSGGQRQRIGIARSLALGPEMLICDEPVSALDVSVQAQILNLLKDLQSELDLTYLFISHNLAVVKYICQRIAVMCAGRIVEIAPTEMLFARPIHPYTRALLAAVPEPDMAQPLNFSALMAGKSSDPSEWPQPFTLGNHLTQMADLGGQHFVRMSPNANVHDALNAA
jgi:peptide/nickel transport system ATP-binding protein